MEKENLNSKEFQKLSKGSQLNELNRRATIYKKQATELVRKQDIFIKELIKYNEEHQQFNHEPQDF